MKKIIITYGLIAGAIVAAMMLFTSRESMIDFEYGELVGYASMILAFSTIYIGTQAYRDKHLDGTISFGNAFKVGIGITLIATAIYVIVWMILINTIAKDFMTEYYQYSIDQIKSSGLSETEINNQIAEMEEFKELYKSPIVQIGVTFLEIFPVGLIVSVISAFILKRGANSDFNN